KGRYTLVNCWKMKDKIERMGPGSGMLYDAGGEERVEVNQ
ncbi:unnamed protein product, partial [Nezara viridula]